MAKYEKFEEWMIGKKVVHDADPNDMGVLLGDVEDSDELVRVRYEEDGNCTAFIKYLNFLEEEEETLPDIPWEVGQEVWDTSFGRGVVRSVYQPSKTTEGQVQVEFDSAKGNRTWYTLDGKYQTGKGVTHRTLFFSEPKIVAETMPPRKPFTPKLKEGDAVVVLHARSGSMDVVKVLREEEDKLYFEHVNGQKDYYSKQHIRVKALGEEIVFD